MQSGTDPRSLRDQAGPGVADAVRSAPLLIPKQPLLRAAALL